jgi:hypothetical protein
LGTEVLDFGTFRAETAIMTRCDGQTHLRSWTVSAGIEPPELAHLVDFAERPRVEDWSLRAALVRYAQPEPIRARTVVELIRRIEAALRPHRRTLERAGPEVWHEFHGRAGVHAELVALLQPAAELDRLGDILATWAVDLAGERPNAAVDAVTEAAARRLDELNVPREERQRPPERRTRTG